MTGFARCEDDDGQSRLVWELRSVNSRFLEPHWRLPEEARALEPQLREALRTRLSRGRIEASLHIVSATQLPRLVPEVLSGLLEHLQAVAVHLPKNAALNYNPSDILGWPGVLQSSTETPHPQRIQTLFLQALDGLYAARHQEGQGLTTVMNARIELLSQETHKTQERLPQLLKVQRQKLLTRCQDFQITLDPGRLEQEIALLAQRSDVQEELDRLQQHLDEFGRLLSQGGAIGRRLDFLVQELHREANTLGAKALDLETTHASLNMKVLIEQLREQVQNIE